MSERTVPESPKPDDDTAPEDAFDRLVELAATICRMPMGAISLIDEERQWFKAKVGLEICETPRDIAFCAHTILGEDVLVVEDAREDSRFRRNPLVLGDLSIRFYAGVPLHSEAGYALGTLCVFDREPGHLDGEQVKALRTLGRAVMAQLDLRLRVRELQQRETDLADARDQAVEASRLKSQFLANMSHELRTPLNSIIGFSELLADGIPGPLNEGQSRCVADVHDSGKQLLGLINDLLDLSKIEAGRMDLDSQDFVLAPVLGAAINAMRPLADQDGLVLEIALPAPDLVARGDPGRVRQVLNNLLSNAVKFTDKGGRVTLRTRRIDDRVEVMIEDTGIGLPAEEQEAIFDEFHQAEGNHSFEGTGLGLALCQRLLALMDGTIRVDSTPGVGSVFSFTLPAADPGS
jgi:signal transduction histidine kinase